MSSQPQQGSETNYSIVSPTADSPWSMDVVAVLPQSVLNADDYCKTGAARSRWHCLALESSSELKVWYAPPKATLTDQKHNLTVATLTHPKLASESNNNIIIRLHVDPQSPTVANIYAVNVQNGNVLLWHLEARTLRHRHSLSTLTEIPLEESETITTFQSALGSAPRLWIGTSQGRVFWISQTPIPLSLNHQLVQQEKSKSFFSSVFGSTEEAPVVQPEVADVVPIGKDTFLVLHVDGTVVHWTMKRSDTRKLFFSSRNFLNLDSIEIPHRNSTSSTLRILHGAASAATMSDDDDESSLHILFLMLSETDDSRLYWARFHRDGTLDVVRFLNRFVDPARDAHVEGLAVTHQQIAYTIVSTHVVDPQKVRLGVGESARSTVALALQGEHVYELDLKVPGSIVTVLPGTFAPDWVKYGIVVWDASGIALRLDLHCDDNKLRTSNTSINQGQARTLQMHLKAVFWDNYARPKQTPRLPPSLMDANAAELEQAVLAFSRQLLEDGQDLETSPTRPLGLLLDLINLLQQTGKYRDLSKFCRWQLLALGEEAKAFEIIASSAPSSNWEQLQLGRLKASSVAEWLEEIQETCLTGGGQDQQVSMLKWFCDGVDAAISFRTEMGRLSYDIDPAATPSVETNENDVPTWISHHSLGTVCQRQVAFWKSHTVVSVNLAQTLCQLWLFNCSDNYQSYHCEETQMAYVHAQREVFSLLRRINTWEKDRFLYELCAGHGYSDGLCQIVFDHEKRGDKASFPMEAVFDECYHKIDVESQTPFSVSILRWFLQRRHFGHVLKYGELCPDALTHWMETDPALAPYRWMHDMKNGDFKSATQSLVENASKESTTLPEALRALNFAKLSNRIVSLTAPGERVSCHKTASIIEKKREIAGAQQDLLGLSENPLESPERLLYHALEMMEKTTDVTKKTDLAFIALTLASTFDSSAVAEEKAAEIWRQAINCDHSEWKKLLDMDLSLTDARLRDSILETTVFGGLLGQMEDVTSNDLERLSYRQPKIEHAVLHEFDPSGQTTYRKMQRMIRNIAGIETSI